MPYNIKLAELTILQIDVTNGGVSWAWSKLWWPLSPPRITFCRSSSWSCWTGSGNSSWVHLIRYVLDCIVLGYIYFNFTGSRTANHMYGHSASPD